MNSSIKRLTLGESFANALDTFKDNWMVVLGSSVLLGVFNSIPTLLLKLMPISFPMQMGTRSFAEFASDPFVVIFALFAIVFTCFSVAFYAGYIGMIIELARGMRVSVFRFITIGLTRFWSFLRYSLLWVFWGLVFILAIAVICGILMFGAVFFVGKTVAVGVVVMLLIILGIYLSLQLLFVFFAFVDKRISFVESVILSVDIAKGHCWRIFGMILSFALMGLVVGGGGAIAFLLLMRGSIAFTDIQIIVAPIVTLFLTPFVYLILSHYYLSALRELGVE